MVLVLFTHTASESRSVTKGRVLTLQEKYDKAEECFIKVPEGDEAYTEAKKWHRCNEWYRDRRGKAPVKTEETTAERDFNNALEHWMGQHLDHIRNLKILLHKFRCVRDGRRRKDGNMFHADLVRMFYERGGSLKVVAVECNDIEPDTDVDIRLEGDIYIQVWRGKMPLDHSLGGILCENRPLTDMNWCEELKPVLKKLRQLPSKTGMGFVLNLVSGINGLEPPLLHELCSERKCVMRIYENKPHINVYGTSDFKYCDEACQIAQALKRPLRFFLGDWNAMQAQGRDPIGESAYGGNISQLLCRKLYAMDKDNLLDYARCNLKYLHYGDLANLPRDALLAHVLYEVRLRDNDCQDGIHG